MCVCVAVSVGYGYTFSYQCVAAMCRIANVSRSISTWSNVYIQYSSKQCVAAINTALANSKQCVAAICIAASNV